MDPRDERRVKELEEEMSALKAAFDGYVKSKQEEEAKKLRTALLWTGAIIIAMSTFIFNEILWPILKAGAGGKP